MKAVHLICRREGHSFVGLTLIDREQKLYRSCCWAFPPTDDLNNLVGGWLYLHPDSKSHPSKFGGVIQEVLLTPVEGMAIEDRYTFVFEARPEGRDQAWRGKHHGMAWTSGIIDASLPHEIG
jgi:hypothetical protein